MVELVDLTNSWGDGSGTEPDMTPDRPVSLALVTDVSPSITDADYRIQREGTALALGNVSDDIVEMAENGTPVIASYTEFAGDAVVRIAPRMLYDAGDIEAFAGEIAAMERSDIKGATLPSRALETTTAIHAQVEEQFGPLSRKITDISVDGYGSQPNNHSQARLFTDSEIPEVNALMEQRQIATNSGIEINGIIMPDKGTDFDRALDAEDPLAIELVTNDVVQYREELGWDDNLTDAELDRFREARPEYFEGPDSSIAVNERFYDEFGTNGFTIRANSAEDYADTLEIKLRRELLIGENGDGNSLETKASFDGGAVKHDQLEF